MEDKDTSHSKLQQRRTEAEATPVSGSATEPAKPVAAERLHEQPVKQIELELQNTQLRQRQLDLEAALERYVELYDFAPTGYLTLTEEGIIAEINFTGAQLLGVERNKLIYKRFAPFIADQDQDRWYQFCLQLIEQGGTQACELSLSRSDGVSLFIHLDCQCIQKMAALPVLRIGFTDMSAQMQVEAAQQGSEYSYRALLQNARDTVVISDINGNPEAINQAGEVLFGYPRDEICRMTLAELHPSDEIAKVRQHYKDITQNNRADPLETKVLCKDGRVVDVDIRSSLVETGGRKMVQSIFIDLTVRKYLETQRLAKDKAHHDALIRLVHHRMNNDLQGIMGMLHLFVQTHSETANPLNQAISRVQSVSVIHGLRSTSVKSSVWVCELTVAIAKSVESLRQQPIIVDIPEDWVPRTVSEAEAVPLALVLNELIFNAAKHSGFDKSVSVMLSRGASNNSMQLAIHNPGLLPSGFSLEAGTGFGTGLKLVAAILPRAGANLSWEQRAHTVVTTLDLDLPVIHLESAP